MVRSMPREQLDNCCAMNLQHNFLQSMKIIMEIFSLTEFEAYHIEKIEASVGRVSLDRDAREIRQKGSRT